MAEVRALLRWLLIALALLSALALWSWGQLARRAQGPAAYALAPQPAATALDRLVAPLLAAHPDASELRWLGKPDAQGTRQALT